jgi:hypothetical protein
MEDDVRQLQQKETTGNELSCLITVLSLLCRSGTCWI